MPLSVENAKRTVSTNLHLPGAGPHPHVSEPVLATVARALGLADTERDYLFALAGLAPVGLQRCGASRAERTRPGPPNTSTTAGQVAAAPLRQPGHSHHAAPPSRTTTSALTLQGGGHVAVATTEKNFVLCVEKECPYSRVSTSQSG